MRLFHPFIEWGRDPASVAPADRRKWRDFADQIGVPLAPTLQWDTLRPALPVEQEKRRYEVHVGELEPVTRQRLFSHLGRHTPPQATFFLFDLAAIIAGHDPFTLEAQVGDIEAVVEWVEERNAAAVSTPELVWPEDRRWIVCCDYDLSSTYLASDASLADDLLADPMLETVEVALETRVDWRADADLRPSP